MRRFKRYWPIFLLAVALFLPALVSGYWLRVFTSALMFAVLAQGANIISGYAGCPALGNIVFFGVGAYGAAVLMTALKMPFLPALLLSGLIGMAYAVLLGVPVLKTRGHYFVMATIGLNDATHELVNNVDFLTQGSRGIALPLPETGKIELLTFFYFVMLAILLATIFATWLMAKSRMGYALKAIKSDDEAARAVGINVTFYRVAAWAMSAFFTAMAGGAFAYWMTFIEPHVVFDIVMSVKMFIMMALGGAGTIIGPTLGAILLELVSETVWGGFPQVHYLVLGAVLVAVVVLLPEGMTLLFGKGATLKTYRQRLKAGRL